MKPFELEGTNHSSELVRDAGISEGLFSEEFMSVLTQQPTRRFIPLYATDPNDTQQVDTSLECWQVVSGGTKYVLNFEKQANVVAVNKEVAHRYQFVQLLKWAAAKFLSSYSAGYIYRILINSRMLFSDIAVFDADSCIRRLKQIQNREVFFPWKRLIALFCEYDFPGFSTDDLFELENISPPSGPDCWQAYYDLEIKFKPAVVRFIEMGIWRDLACLDAVSTADLRSLATLVLCYESGMRPTQLFKLKEEDFQNRRHRYFSIRIPPAKQAKRIERIPFELDLSPEAGVILQTLIDRSRPDLANNQLLRLSDGNIALTSTFDTALNSRLRAWAARNFVGPVPEAWELKDFLRHLPRLTAYDFRHHVGHSLAMSGASADHIARILGHSSTVVARHYIAATPELAVIKQKALGENAAYQEMMGMILTGQIGEEYDWRGRKVAGMFTWTTGLPTW